MGERSAREQAEEILAAAIQRTASRPALSELYQQLCQSADRLEKPMRVAIVGKIKAGKSTMMNAMLGEGVVATGTVETTFNVNWLRYGDDSSLVVHYKDSRPPERKPLEDLEGLTRRADENRDLLNSIEYIEVYHPNPLLRSFNLIDTPGLESHYSDDSENTLRFLQLHGQELTEATQAEAVNADAILHLFTHNLHAADQLIAEEFQGPALGQATPVNALGVLTKVDTFWPAVPDPMEAGRRICESLQGNPAVRNLFYTVCPVCGLMGLGAQTLTADELDALCRLGSLPTDRFEQLARFAERFATRDYPDIPVAAAERKKLLERLGPYGVSLSVQLVREGASDLDSLSRELLRRSGIPELRSLILAHFGNRAHLIKLMTGLRRTLAACFWARRRTEGADQQVATEIGGRLEELEARQHVFQELRVLRDFYEGKLDLDEDERAQLLEVTGEHGTSCWKRLGLENEVAVGEMLAIAKERRLYWHRRANDWGVDQDTIQAAAILSHSYERVEYRLAEVSRHLDLPL